MIQEVKTYMSALISASYQQKVKANLSFSDKFNHLLLNKLFNHEYWFEDKPLLIDESGNPDYLGSAFYMVNSLQEHGNRDRDHFNRFKYVNSYQSKFSCTKENLVDQYLRAFLKSQGVDLAKPKSKVFISHDIDLINSSIKQDSYYLLKQGDFAYLFQHIFNFLVGKRAWRNIDKIMSIESLYDFKATYFWIAQNDFDKNSGIKNGDYKINSKYVKNTLQEIANSDNYENGLHKSSLSSTLNDEIAKFPIEEELSSNRYHYLKFNPEENYPKLSNSKVRVDCSLGFAEKIGFRNSFGLPFKPFDLETKKSYNFLEVPLHVMDTTFLTYGDSDAEKMEENIISFFEANNRNAVMSLLWHNDKCSHMKYGEYLKVFKNLMAYLYENRIESCSLTELYNDYTKGY